MKICKVLLIICLFNLHAKSQILERSFSADRFGNYIYFDAQPDHRSVLYKNAPQGIYVPDHAVWQAFDKKATKRKLSSPIALGVKLNPELWYYGMAPIQSFSKSIPAFRIKDKSAATVIALGINKNNIADYRYHVVLNDSVEIIHWSAIPKLEQNYGAKQPYGFIGNFNYPGKQALVEVINTKDYNLRAGVAFDWRTDVKPFVYAVIGGASAQKPTQTIDFATVKDPVTQKVLTINCVKGTTSYLSLYVRPHAGVAYSSGISRDENNKLLYRSQGEEEDINGAIRFNIDTLDVGRYDVYIYPNADGIFAIPNQETHVELNITPPPKSTSILEKKASFKQLIPYTIGAVLVTALLFWLYRRRATTKLAKAAQAKQTTSLKLRSIRAQLNPHFMFNALTSIQNLVNKKDMEGANHYLSRFADLTRKVLFTSERDMISLEDEIKILDDYLQMEQLRFGFKYDISVADDINVANIEVPAMLLQPFVENAVKHGVANLREKGGIAVLISQKQTDLVFTITDNGLGFSSQASGQSGDSFGLKLSEERIDLLNEVYQDQPTRLDIRSNDGGTTVTVMLTNWIS
jgi:two-component system LytT family sensor kinase